MSQSQNNKVIVRHFLDAVFNRRDSAILDRYAEEDVVDHLPGTLAFYLVLSAFPDARISIDHMVAEGEHVTVLSQFQGTHQGTFMSIPPTGKGVTGRVAFNFRLIDGKIAETWTEFEPWGLMQQMGIQFKMPANTPLA